MALKGSPQLRARLKAIKQTFKPYGRDWADDVVRVGKPMIQTKTGASRASLRRRNATQRKATVVGSYVLYFLDHGTKAHDEKPKHARALRFQRGQNTIFARKVHKRATSGSHFRERAAREALRRNPMAQELIRQWNEAAR
jgi:hypothetical protein